MAHKETDPEFCRFFDYIAGDDEELGSTAALLCRWPGYIEGRPGAVMEMSRRFLDLCTEHGQRRAALIAWAYLVALKCKES